MPPKRAATAQRSLFESSPGVVADDERGRITYTPGFVTPTVAQAWFEALRNDVEWKAERRRMYDRDVDNDHLDELVEGFPIALLSLGATRRMTIRTKAPPRRSLHVDLESGSLVMMSYETQLHYTHGVPKVAHPVGERISLAFRVKPARASSEDDTRRDFYR